MQTFKQNNSQNLESFDPENQLNCDILLELGNIGSGNATTALADILNERIVVEVPRLHVSPPHLVPRLFGSRDNMMTVIYMQLRGEADCDILLVLEMEEAKRIAAMMAMTTPEELDEDTENSAVAELGNIMIGGFLSAIADFTGVEMVPRPPSLVRGPFECVLDSFLVKQALLTEAALVFDACFRRSTSEVGGSLVVFPSVELQELLVTQSQEWL
ncbi:MAG: chemotaxis protein CheC [Candidatus Bathyarchaeota archaeon]|nr:chemotaxis protein CheC [Candidatus Bathyarchaeum tardum]WGM90033.1 MAG: chemotaxis protein CheC [Candidatus Bathyarchaeum tardum]WNZ29825.1 MAG: chemotaxis protein CheC [Candidatus Bathyarchaeota archaeon]